MFPVKLELNGKNGINPIKLLIQMKKKIVKRYGILFRVLVLSDVGYCDFVSTNKTNGSKNPANPFGAFSFFLYDLATAVNNKNKITTDINIENTFLVIEKFKGLASKLKAFLSSSFNCSNLSA